VVKPIKRKLSTKKTEEAREEKKSKCEPLNSIADSQYSITTGKLLPKSLTELQKDEIEAMAKRNVIAVDPRHGRWLPGVFRYRKKTGGRKEGTRNKYADVRDILADIGCNPVLGMARIAMNKKNEIGLRARMYTELAQYCHPKVRQVDHKTGDSNQHNTLTVQIVGTSIPGQPELEPIDDAEILPYEEDGVTHHALDGDDEMALQPDDHEKVEDMS